MSTNVSLTPEIERYARGLVSGGFYGSVSEVVREALRLHQKQEQLWLKALHQELDNAAKEIDTDQTMPFDMQGVINRIDQKRKKAEK